MYKALKVFPYIVLISALLVSITSSAYSIYGIGRIFAGHQVGALFMAFALELGNIVTAAALKIYWNDLPKMLRNYLCSAVIVLSIITSIGIYGFLSDGYQLTFNADKIIDSKLELLSRKKERFELNVSDYKRERDEVNTSISNLRKSLATDNQYQTVDKRGNVLTQIQNTNKKGVQSELNISTSRALELSDKIDACNDSISFYELKIIEVKSKNDVSSELGALKFASKITGKSMDYVVNIFLILLMSVFQPLAIALILTALFAFGKNPSIKPEEINSLPVENISSEPIEVSNEPVDKVKKTRKKRAKKVPDDSEMEYPKTFNIEIEGLQPYEEPSILDKNEVDSESVLEEEIPIEKKPKKRKIVERSLTDDLARQISETLNKKKV